MNIIDQTQSDNLISYVSFQTISNTTDQINSKCFNTFITSSGGVFVLNSNNIKLGQLKEISVSNNCQIVASFYIGTNLQSILNLVSETVLLKYLSGNIWSVVKRIPFSSAPQKFFFDPNTESFAFDDFITGVNTSALGWAFTGFGTGASSQNSSAGNNDIDKAIGVLQIDTGTTATGRVSLTRSLLTLGYCIWEIIWRIKIQKLSLPTELFFTQWGFIDNTGVGDPVDGVYFGYSSSINNGNLTAYCRSNNIETSVDTGILADTNFHTFKILVNELATSVEFYIDDTLVATITTNIPVGTNRSTSIGIKIEKTIGIDQVGLFIDYYKELITIPSGRQ